jgi:hypothetical protein
MNGNLKILEPGDIDVKVDLPKELHRLVKLNIVDLTPWQILSRDVALKKLKWLRSQFSPNYVPFAWRKDRDELACIEPEYPNRIQIVCASEAKDYERAETYDSFWNWFREAINEMILYE